MEEQPSFQLSFQKELSPPLKLAEKTYPDHPMLQGREGGGRGRGGKTTERVIQ